MNASKVKAVQNILQEPRKLTWKATPAEWSKSLLYTLWLLRGRPLCGAAVIIIIIIILFRYSCHAGAPCRKELQLVATYNYILFYQLFLQRTRSERSAVFWAFTSFVEIWKIYSYMPPDKRSALYAKN